MDSKNNMEGQRPPRRTALVASELNRYNIDIAALSETRFPDSDSLTEVGEGYTFFWQGLPKEAVRIHGVGFAIKTSLMKNLPESPIGVNERIMTLRIPLTNYRYATLVSVYAPTLTYPDEVKNTFYDQLDEVLRSIPRTDKLILLGDLNARVGTNYEVWGGIIGRHGVGKENDNGIRLLNLCATHDLVITNTIFQLPNKHKTTWMHPRSKHWHLIDYIITKKSDLKDITITRAFRGADCWTDHRLICSNVCFQIRPPVRRQGKKKQIDRISLQNSSKRNQLREAIHAAFGQQPEPDPTNNYNAEQINDMWDDFSTTLYNTAIEVLGVSKRSHQDWFDDNNMEIRTLLQNKNRAHVAAINNPTSQRLRATYADLRSRVQSTLRNLQNAWWQNKAHEIQAFADSNDQHNFYDAIKRIYGPTRGNSAPLRSADGDTLIKDTPGILNRWVEYLNELLNRTNPVDQSFIDHLPQLPEIASLDMPPTFCEIHLAIKNLKNNKATGPDGIPGELLKFGGYCLTRRLYKLILTIWTSGIVPQAMKNSLMIMIYKKKGNKAECGNYRGISLLAVAGKVLARVLLIRLLSQVANVVLPESQCGFRQERGTTDMIFVARLLQEKCREQHQDLYIAFIDLTKAFDTINRDILWKILTKCGCPPKFTGILQGFHDGMTSRVTTGGLVSEPFHVNVGVKQGCVLAPIIFNIYLSALTLLARHDIGADDGIRYNYRLDGSLFNIRRLKARTKISSSTIYDLQYADDAAFPANSTEALQRTLDIMSEKYNNAGLLINTQKTEVMRQPAVQEAQPGPNLTVGDEPLKNVDSFTYLGSILTSNCNIDSEIQKRIRNALASFGSLNNKVFSNIDLTITTKISVYTAVCLSILLYGSEAWTLYRSHTKSLEAFHIRCLQRILGITWRDRIPHVSILQQASSCSIETMIIERQLRWVGHVTRMAENRIPRQILYGELAEGQRLPGGPKKRYKDHLKTALKKCEIPFNDIETLASDRPTWRRTCKQGVTIFEAKITQAQEERRRKRHERTARGPIPPGEGIACPTCGRLCASEFGLRSHQRSHLRRNPNNDT